METRRLLDVLAWAKKRRPWVWGGLAFLLAAALMALVISVVYGHDSKVSVALRATTLGTVVNVNPRGYQYRYANNACAGDGTQSPSLAIGAQVRIFYDPNKLCDNLDYDPVARQRSDLIWLLGFSAVFALAVGSAGWDAAKPR